MNQGMQPFIVSAIRTISQSLQRVSPQNIETLADADAVESLQAIEQSAADFRLDITSAEVVNEGSLIFPNPALESDSDWCVLQSFDLDRDGGVRTFRLKARLRANLNPEEFVRRAYECILMRFVDDDGLKIYPPLIANHQLSRREVLKILADSDEAKSLNVKVLIVPHPSSWLSTLQANWDDDSSFPPLLIPVRAP